jgi:2-hydroxymuconate-semialdehyde hydrolase
MSAGEFESVHHLTVDGHAMAYRTAGTGSPVVLVHGIPTNSLLWRHVQGELAADHQVYAVDMIGYGSSDKPEDADPSVANQARWLSEFLMACRLESVVLVGHDIGGGVAQLVAAQHPELIARLVLIDTIAYDSWPEPNIARLKDPKWDERFESIDLVAGFQRGLQGGMVDTDLATQDTAKIYAEPFMAASPSSYLRVARALRTEDTLDATTAIEAINVPTTIVWGAEDSYQDVKYGQRLAEALADAQLVVLENVGHFVPEEAPEELASIIATGRRK